MLAGSTDVEVLEPASTVDEIEPALSQADVLVAAVADETEKELRPALSRADSAVVITAFEPEKYLSLGLSLGGFALLDVASTPDEIVCATLAAANGLFVAEPGTLAALVVAPTTLREPVELREQLTAREIEVLTMMAEGLGNKTIAYRLRISDHTVKFHVGSILRKLDAESRTEAVTQGIRRGYISV